MGRVGMFMGLAMIDTAGEYGIAGYSFHRTVTRDNTKHERTQKMAGAGWNAYIPGVRASREWLAGWEKEDMFITSTDGLRLHGILFLCEGSKRVMTCFRRCISEGLNDLPSITRFYLEKGFNLIVADERAHGKSEGIYTGFGRLDRHDALGQIRCVISHLGQNCGLMLHGISMGSVTVLMTTGLTLPPRARVAVSDCAFTSAWEVLSHVLRSMYHVPAFPMMQIADRMARKEVGYGLNECNARGKAKRVKIPVLFIRGDRDMFMPCSMVYDLYNAYRSPKSLLVISGASRAEAYYKDTESYEDTVDQLIRRYPDH